MKNNKNIFSLINSFLITLFALSIVETFTYSGFIAKHFDVKVGLGIILLFVVAFVVLRRFFKSTLFGKFILFSTYLFTFIYVVFDTLERVTYLNFVFSRFHLHVHLLLLSATLLSIIFLINSDRKKVNTYVFTVLVVILIQYLVTDIVVIAKSNIGFMLKNPKATYDQKMEVVIEKKPYNYALFIKNNTPENAKILIPPQGYPWPQTGNKAYFRYFIYPRTLINGNEKDANVDIKEVDYVLIAYGETTISEYGFTNVWPKFDVKGEYILYWDPETGEITKEEKGIYKYNENDKTEKWGIIKIKH